MSDTAGDAPRGLEAECGWTSYKTNKGEQCWSHPSSTRIGWVADDRVYLDADEAMRLTQIFAKEQNRPLSNPNTVLARLVERGWLVVEQTGGKTRYRTRKYLGGVRRTNLLAFHTTVFWPPEPEPQPQAS